MSIKKNRSLWNAVRGKAWFFFGYFLYWETTWSTDNVLSFTWPRVSGLCLKANTSARTVRLYEPLSNRELRWNTSLSMTSIRPESSWEPEIWEENPHITLTVTYTVICVFRNQICDIKKGMSWVTIGEKLRFKFNSDKYRSAGSYLIELKSSNYYGIKCFLIWKEIFVICMCLFWFYLWCPTKTKKNVTRARFYSLYMM